MNIQEELFKLKDEKYGEFQSGLIPGIKRETVIGVRVPAIRALAKKIQDTEDCESFLKVLPHDYYDENLLHSVLLCGYKDFDSCMKKVEAFLPYVDNWAVCDTLKPKCFEKHKAEVLEKIKQWIKSDRTYTCRFGIGMLMCFFLDDDFKGEYNELVAAVKSDEYYVNMMIAWYFATALAKQWESTVPYLQKDCLEKWTHNKTIQKACESFRITGEQKVYLKTLRDNKK